MNNELYYWVFLLAGIVLTLFAIKNYILIGASVWSWKKSPEKRMTLTTMISLFLSATFCIALTYFLHSDAVFHKKINSNVTQTTLSLKNK